MLQLFEEFERRKAQNERLVPSTVNPEAASKVDSLVRKLKAPPSVHLVSPDDVKELETQIRDERSKGILDHSKEMQLFVLKSELHGQAVADDLQNSQSSR